MAFDPNSTVGQFMAIALSAAAVMLVVIGLAIMGSSIRRGDTGKAMRLVLIALLACIPIGLAAIGVSGVGRAMLEWLGWV